MSLGDPVISIYGPWLLLVVTVYCFPNESLEIALILGLRLKTLLLNAVLLALSFYFYIKLAWAFRSNGMKAPAFSFTPIQNRSDV